MMPEVSGVNPAILILAMLVALLSSWTTRFLCTSAASRSPLDHPNVRSLHTVPTPRTGGLAILSGVVIGLVFAQGAAWMGYPLWNGDDSGLTGMIWLWILGLTLLLGVVSFWDDRSGLPPAVRIGLHGLVAAGVVWGAGLMVEVVPVPFFGTIALGALAAPMTLLGLMWITNLYNFMDGMDGFAGGMSVVGFGMLGYLAWRGGAQQLALVSLLIAVAAAGFLVFNLPPARIFLGDVGSIPLGFLAGTLSVAGVRNGIFDLWVPVLIFLPFVVDATVTLFRRLLRGVKVWQAHREHYYQRLVLAGWGHRKTMLAEYGLMLASGTTAVLYVHAKDLGKLVILLAWATGYVLLAWGVRVTEHGRDDRVSEA